MVCGQLKMKAAIPRLNELLKDQEHSLISTGGSEWFRHYYVREAAKEALESLGEKVEGVVVEERRTKKGSS